jgi:hypothetical protein
VRKALGLTCFRDMRCSFRGMMRGCIAFTITYPAEKQNPE